DYALGLTVGTFETLREVSHSGSTAGYSAFLTRFPDQRVSVAVLCNVSTNATLLAHQVAGHYLTGMKPSPPMDGIALTPETIGRLQGMYRNIGTGTVRTVAPSGQAIRIEAGQPLVTADGKRFGNSSSDERWDFDGEGHATVTDRFGTVDR